MTKHVGLFIVSTMILGLTAACGQLNLPSSNTNNPGNSNSSSASNEGFSAPIVAPPSYDNRPLKPGQTASQETLPNGLPALRPLKGVNVDTLFSENIGNADRRFERVENAVTELRKEFEVVKPAIIRLVAVENDIQALIEQIEVLIAEGLSKPAPSAASFADNRPLDLSSSKQAQPAPAHSAGQIPEAAASASALSGSPVVQNLRTGIHKDKIRLVLDANQKTPFSVDLDSSENLLIIELPSARWTGSKRSGSFGRNALLSSYNVESVNDGKGTRIVVILKKQTRVLRQEMIAPGITPQHRYYVDLAL